jgi:hypothetical protein
MLRISPVSPGEDYCGSMAKTTNGKTNTHFEQIPVAAIEKIAIIGDVPGDRERPRRTTDPAGEPGPAQPIRTAVDRRRSPASPPASSRKES